MSSVADVLFAPPPPPPPAPHPQGLTSIDKWEIQKACHWYYTVISQPSWTAPPNPPYFPTPKPPLTLPFKTDHNQQVGHTQDMAICTGRQHTDLPLH